MTDILIVVNDEMTIYNFRRELLTALSQRGFHLIVAMPDGQHRAEIEACGCTVAPLKVNRRGKNPFQDLHMLWDCRQLIRKYRPKLVLTYTVKPNIYGSIAARLEKTPYMNNVTGLGSVLQGRSILQYVVLSLQRIAFRQSACVFFQNRSNYQALLKRDVITDRTPVVILPGSGVNLTLHAYEPPPSDNEPFRFMIVARIRRDKGYEEFLMASELLKRNHPSTEFHIVGWYEDLPLRQRIEALAEAGVVQYHGSKTQEEVHQLIAASSCIVLPSYHEGMANVLLEAAAAGRPVIASRIPGCEEAFEEGVTGLGCRPHDVPSLTSAMLRMLELPYDRRVAMGAAGRKKMEAQFDRQLVISKYLDQIEKTLGDNNYDQHAI